MMGYNHSIFTESDIELDHLNHTNGQLEFGGMNGLGAPTFVMADFDLTIKATELSVFKWSALDRDSSPDSLREQFVLPA